MPKSVYAYVCAYVHIYVYTCLCLDMSTCLCPYLYVYIYVYVYIYARAGISVTDALIRQGTMKADGRGTNLIRELGWELGVGGKKVSVESVRP